MRPVALITFLAVATVLSAKSPQLTPTPTAQNLNQSQNPHLRLHGNVIAAAVWPRGNPVTKLYVCWENPDPKFQAGMLLVRRAVTDSWEKAAKVVFEGWEKCAPVSRGIRILIDDSGPHTEQIGRQLEVEEDGVVHGQRNGMYLNFTFANWGASCQTTKEACIYGIAVHEFGHALGLVHEQNKLAGLGNFKVPGECLAQDKAQGPVGDTALTPYDPQSVMNYCNPQWNTGKLSALDIDSIRQLYGG